MSNGVTYRDNVTGTCFIQKIYAPRLLYLVLSKEEEGAYIFLMKQVPVDNVLNAHVVTYFDNHVLADRLI